MDKKRVTLRKRIVCQALEKQGDERQGTVCAKDGMGIHLSHEGIGFMSYGAYRIGAEVSVTVRRNPHDKCTMAWQKGRELLRRRHRSDHNSSSGPKLAIPSNPVRAETDGYSLSRPVRAEVFLGKIGGLELLACRDLGRKGRALKKLLD